MPAISLRLLTVAFCAVLAACGGGGSGNTATTPTDTTAGLAPTDSTPGPSQETPATTPPNTVPSDPATPSTPPPAATADPTQARFFAPEGIKFSANGDLYIVDRGNYTIRKIAGNGVTTTIAGAPGVQGSADGNGSAATFTEPRGITVDKAGNLYITDGSVIRKITSAGMVTTLAGTQGVFGTANGIGAAASFQRPYGVAADVAGNLYVADEFGQNVRKVSPAGVVTTFAGGGTRSGTVTDGVGTQAYLFGPRGITIDAAGSLYITDVAGLPGTSPILARGYADIRKISPAAVVTTLARGSGFTVSCSFVPDLGQPAVFDNSNGIEVDGNGTLYIADGCARIKTVSSTGAISTLPVALENSLNGIRLDSQGNLYGTDSVTHTVLKISAAGAVSVYAGKKGEPGSADTP